MIKLYKKNQNEQGSLTLELAFITPVLLMIILGSIFLGLAFINKSALLDASFAGAQTAGYYGGDTQEVREDIYAMLQTRYLRGPNNVQVSIKYLAADGTNYEQTQAANEVEVTTPVPAMPGTAITVTTYTKDYNLNIPFVSNRTFDLVGTSVSQNNNQ